MTTLLSEICVNINWYNVFRMMYYLIFRYFSFGLIMVYFLWYYFYICFISVLINFDKLNKKYNYIYNFHVLSFYWITIIIRKKNLLKKKNDYENLNEIIKGTIEIIIMDELRIRWMKIIHLIKKCNIK